MILWLIKFDVTKKEKGKRIFLREEKRKRKQKGKQKEKMPRYQEREINNYNHRKPN